MRSLPRFPEYFNYSVRSDHLQCQQTLATSFCQAASHSKANITDQQYSRRKSKSNTFNSLSGENTGLQTLCAICNRNFSTNWSLRRHFLLHKPTRKKYECPSCPKEFSWPGDLRTHIRYIHGIEPLK